MHITFYLTMLRPSGSQAIWPGAGAVDIPGIGRCREDVMEGGNWTLCASPLRAPSNFLVLDQVPGLFLFAFSSRSRIVDYPPGPVFSFGAAGFLLPATLISLEPIAHFRRDVDLNDVSLADYRDPVAVINPAGELPGSTLRVLIKGTVPRDQLAMITSAAALKIAQAGDAPEPGTNPFSRRDP